MRLGDLAASTRRWNLGGEDRLHLLDEQGQMDGCHLENHRFIGSAVVMDQAMPHAGNERPGNRCMGFLEGVGQLQAASPTTWMP